MFDINYILLLREGKPLCNSVKAMTEEIELIEAIQAFCERHADGGKAMAYTTFGRRVLNNPNFYDDLLKGRSPTGRTVKKIKVWMKNEDTKLRRRERAEPTE